MRSGSRKPSPISTISPRLTRTSRPAARASPAAGTAARSASRVPRPRRARAPVAVSYSTSTYAAAATTASTAASERGARPMLVCTTTPVALRSGRRVVLLAGRADCAAVTTSSGAISPVRTSAWADRTAALTVAAPCRAAAATSSGCAISTSVRGTVRRGSACATPTSSPAENWRRWTGIEPARPRYSASPVLKTGGTTRCPDTSTPTVPIAGSAGSGGRTAYARRGWGMTAGVDTVRLTQFAHGGGCACKIPPGELEDMVRGLTGIVDADLLVGLDDGDDAAAVMIADGLAVLATADFFTPVVDDAYDWGRIAAANALSDIYAMGGRPVLAVNLLGWPRDVLPPKLPSEVLRGGLDKTRLPDCPVAGGHSIDDPEQKYGMAVTGVADPDRLLRNDAAGAGLPLSLTKPLGVGVLNNRHKATGEVFPEAVTSMVALNDVASRHALERNIRAATDVTGFGLLGHLYKMARASGVTAVVD